MYENYYLSFFAPEKNFVLVERERIDKVLNELKLQYSGLVDIGLQQKLGKMIGASHLLIIDYSRVVKPNSEMLDIEIHKLIEVSSGKILASVPFNIKVVVQNKTAPSDLFSEGYHYLESGKYQEAIETFTKVMEINPNDTDALGNRGLAYSRHGNHEQAIKDFTRLIELKPKDAKAYYARALAYSEVGSHYLALDDFRTAARLGYKDAQDYLRSRGMQW
ncbi:MAG: tetratricopeptide repeat protein [Nitrospirota bacterium]